MNSHLSEKTALVCGASQGIGRAIAEEFARQGGNVLALARSPLTIKPVVNELPGPGRHEALALDLADLAALEAVITQVLARRNRIDILVINSGGPPGGPLLVAQPKDFTDALASHLLAASKLVALCVPAMKAAGYGRIIAVSSTSVKSPIVGLGVSNTIRGAMANWAKTLSYELAADGITVNTVLPGYTETPRLQSLLAAEAERQKTTTAAIAAQWQSTIPCGRFAQPREIAAAVAFLAGPQASYINGVCLAVDGGRTRAL